MREFLLEEYPWGELEPTENISPIAVVVNSRDKACCGVVNGDIRVAAPPATRILMGNFRDNSAPHVVVVPIEGKDAAFILLVRKPNAPGTFQCYAIGGSFPTDNQEMQAFLESVIEPYEASSIEFDLYPHLQGAAPDILKPFLGEIFQQHRLGGGVIPSDIRKKILKFEARSSFEKLQHTQRVTEFLLPRYRILRDDYMNFLSSQPDMLAENAERIGALAARHESILGRYTGLQRSIRDLSTELEEADFNELNYANFRQQCDTIRYDLNQLLADDKNGLYDLLYFILCALLPGLYPESLEKMQWPKLSRTILALSNNVAYEIDPAIVVHGDTVIISRVCNELTPHIDIACPLKTFLEKANCFLGVAPPDQMHFPSDYFKNKACDLLNSCLGAAEITGLHVTTKFFADVGFESAVTTFCNILAALAESAAAVLVQEPRLFHDFVVVVIPQYLKFYLMWLIAEFSLAKPNTVDRYHEVLRQTIAELISNLNSANDDIASKVQHFPQYVATLAEQNAAKLVEVQTAMMLPELPKLPEPQTQATAALTLFDQSAKRAAAQSPEPSSKKRHVEKDAVEPTQKSSRVFK